MKKSVFYLFALICAVSLFSSCSDDDKKDEPKEDTSWKAVSGTYATDKLKATFNGQELTGKSITVETVSADKAIATLVGIVAGAPELKVDLVMSKATKAEQLIADKYQLEGTAVVDSRTVSLKGSVDAGVLTLNVTIKVDSKLVGKWGFPNLASPADINGDGVINQNDYNVMGGSFFLKLSTESGEITFGDQSVPDFAFCIGADQKVETAIAGAAPELTFLENGNIVISFTKAGNTVSLPETLLGYYIKDKMLYVTCDIMGIIGLLGKAEDNPLQGLMMMAQNGIPLICEAEGNTASIFINNTLATSLLTNLQPILPLLPGLGILPEGSEGMIAQITGLLPLIQADKEFMVGVNLVKK